MSCFFTDYNLLKDALNARKKAVATAQAKLKSLQHKIGKLKESTDLMSILNANICRWGTEKVE